jgi:(E)-4-hydroxy-3-methylbut-2-enyl-diphosphate synthase
MMPGIDKADNNNVSGVSRDFSGYRRKSRVVHVGDVPLGGDFPLRVQSMTNTSTLDAPSTISQIIQIADAGADYVRMTVRTVAEATNLGEIKKGLSANGYHLPLIADVHYNPVLAELAAKHVEKVRINPGNFGGILRVKKTSLTEELFETEFQEIRRRFVSLIRVCKEFSTAIRIGVNHGSLSPRILSTYGDSFQGMSESAMEFLRICREEDFHQVVVSLKSSNTRTMVLANEYLVSQMDREGLNYPLHLGVTEAGSEEDGRIKSAVGIGTLLSKGIGDTIRISLSEDPANEIPVARQLVRFFHSGLMTPSGYNKQSTGKGSLTYHERRPSHPVGSIGGKNPPVVIAEAPSLRGPQSGQTMSPDFSYYGGPLYSRELSLSTPVIIDYHHWLNAGQPDGCYPLFTLEEYRSAGDKSSHLNFLSLHPSLLSDGVIEEIKTDSRLVLVLDTSMDFLVDEIYAVFGMLDKSKCSVPVIVKRDYKNSDDETFLLRSSAETGVVFLEGVADGIWLGRSGRRDQSLTVTTSFSILQATRARISKTEYISCPTCGRTSFQLEATLREVKKRTSHLRGLKIAVMGCMVNGPGEMADADYGYVGSSKGRVNLYRGQKIIIRNVPEETAVDELIGLIKESGDWQGADD